MSLADCQTRHELCAAYLQACHALMQRISLTQSAVLDRAAVVLAGQIQTDQLIHIYGPGGHSALAAQEIFYRAGGLMHVVPIFDQATSLVDGALRSTAMERLPGHGRVIVEQAGLRRGNVLLLVNAFGVNAAVIDAALAARALGVVTIGLSAIDGASRIAPDHPARHPSKASLHDLVDIAIDTGVPDGDTTVKLAGIDAALGPVSTMVNAFALNTLVLNTIGYLADRGLNPPIWRSRNASDGDCYDGATVDAMRLRVKSL